LGLNDNTPLASVGCLATQQFPLLLFFFFLNSKKKIDRQSLPEVNGIPLAG
jgi:hypothetical protein